MGSEIGQSGSDKPRVSLSVIGTDELEFVEIVKYDGQWGILHRYTRVGKKEFAAQYLDKEFHRDSMYYIRLAQVNGSMAWSSPVWVHKE